MNKPDQHVTSRPTIAVDMDEVIADVMPKFVDLYHARFGRRPGEDELAGRKIYDLEGALDIREALFERGFFRDLPLVAGAREGLEFLRGHLDIYFVTAAMEFRNSFEDKFDWLHEHFAWADWRNIVFCGDKSIVHTDYLLDDHAKNLVTFRGTPLLFDAFHNREETRFTRLTGWPEVTAYFERELADARAAAERGITTDLESAAP